MCSWRPERAGFHRARSNLEQLDDVAGQCGAEDDALAVGHEPGNGDRLGLEGLGREAHRCGASRRHRAAGKDSCRSRDDERGEHRQRQARRAAALGRWSDDSRRRGGAARERLERKGHIARRLESLAWIFLETMANDAIQSRRDLGSSAGEFGRVFFEDCGHRLGRRVALERALAGQHFVEHRAQGKQIAPRVGGLPAHLLGRHVADRAHHRARMRDHRRRHRRALWRRSNRRRTAAVRARPKSRIFTWPSGSRKMFSGFRSRWTMPLSCAAASPRAT